VFGLTTAIMLAKMPVRGVKRHGEKVKIRAGTTGSFASKFNRVGCAVP
jgi:hypothetical protein